MAINNQNFYLKELSIEVNAVKALIHGGQDTTDFTETYHTAQLDIPVSYARHLFQYQSDSIDVNDLNSYDNKFRMFHKIASNGDITGDTLKFFNTKNIIPAEAIVDELAKVPFYRSNDVYVNENKVNADYVRYIAQEVFGVPVADLFSNERTVRGDLVRKSAFAFNEQIQTLADFRVDYGTAETPDVDYVRMITNFETCPTYSDTNTEDVKKIYKAQHFPSRLIFSQLLNSAPERFANLDTFDGESMLHLYDSSDEAKTVEQLALLHEDLWRYMPFLVGDKIFFLFKVIPPTDQESVTKAGQLDSETNIADYYYRIQLNIVSDTADSITGTESTDTAFVRGWDADGWNSGTGIDTTGTGFAHLSYLADPTGVEAPTDVTTILP